MGAGLTARPSAPGRPCVRVETDGPVTILRVDRPPRNFVGVALSRDLEAALRRAEGNPATRAIVLASAVEGTFIGHVDVPEVLPQLASAPRLGVRTARLALGATDALDRLPLTRRALDGGPLAGLAQVLRLHRVALRLSHGRKVTIAAIGGDALGPGCDLALACDLRVMARGDHRIGSPELTIGVIPGIGAAHRMARLTGPGRAFEHLLLGRVFSADEAHAAGLVHEAVEASVLERRALELADIAARRAPAAVRALKRALYDGAARPTRRALALERALFMSAASADAVGSAMRRYAAELARLEGVPPWSVPRELARWQAGEVERSS